GLQPAATLEPDYSQLDLYDAPTLAAFIKQTVSGAIQGAMAPHQPALAGARQQQEYNVIQAKHGADPDFQRKAALTTQLVQGNPNISFEGTYNLVSTIQQSLAPAQKAAASAIEHASHVQAAPANQAKPTTTLTPEQQQAKADQ